VPAPINTYGNKVMSTIRIDYIVPVVARDSTDLIGKKGFYSSKTLKFMHLDTTTTTSSRTVVY
jgi:hypothetical protein